MPFFGWSPLVLAKYLMPTKKTNGEVDYMSYQVLIAKLIDLEQMDRTHYYAQQTDSTRYYA